MKFTVKIILLLVFIPLTSQNLNVTESINGTYYLLEAERGSNTKLFEFSEHKGLKFLLIASCKQCMPASYSYQKDASEELNRLVFYNPTGLYIFQYDEDSFVMIMIDPKAENWTDFYFSNFYSKSKSKVATMSNAKIEDFIIKLSN